MDWAWVQDGGGKKRIQIFCRETCWKTSTLKTENEMGDSRNMRKIDYEDGR